ncbi:MAG: methionine--tRNA ligase subunit beta [Candidatus Levybacteria bacterium RIFCSPLOWO2_01_FULL_38_23]|nr:MAG: methionine--tRNA ligase subunit beta [Candidatus Levybacteria bacterium RIFCSPLOWO2_01_FULL_38_23]
MGQITFADWKKMEMRVGKIHKVERVPKTDKLYKLQVEIGSEKMIQIVTGLVPFYSEKELQNKKIIVLVNLEPVKFKGELSEGMLLCAEDKENNKCILLTVEKDIAAGTLIT